MKNNQIATPLILQLEQPWTMHAKTLLPPNEQHSIYALEKQRALHKNLIAQKNMLSAEDFTPQVSFTHSEKMVDTLTFKKDLLSQNTEAPLLNRMITFNPKIATYPLMQTLLHTEALQQTPAKVQQFSPTIEHTQ